MTDYTYDPAGRPQALWTPNGEVKVKGDVGVEAH